MLPTDHSRKRPSPFLDGNPPLVVAGLIVLMAQMGCYVPAELAVVPVRDRLLSRIGTGDDMENNVSTFLMEMREVSQVCTPPDRREVAFFIPSRTPKLIPTLIPSRFFVRKNVGPVFKGLSQPASLARPPNHYKCPAYCRHTNYLNQPNHEKMPSAVSVCGRCWNESRAGHW